MKCKFCERLDANFPDGACIVCHGVISTAAIANGYAVEAGVVTMPCNRRPGIHSISATPASGGRNCEDCNGTGRVKAGESK
jgi:hypothetical protein